MLTSFVLHLLFFPLLLRLFSLPVLPPPRGNRPLLWGLSPHFETGLTTNSTTTHATLYSHLDTLRHSEYGPENVLFSQIEVTSAGCNTFLLESGSGDDISGVSSVHSRIWGWGCCSNGLLLPLQLNDTSYPILLFSEVGSDTTTTVMSLQCGLDSCLFVDSQSALWGWGLNSKHSLGNPGGAAVAFPQMVLPWVEFFGTGSHVTVVSTLPEFGWEVLAAGTNSFWQFGTADPFVWTETVWSTFGEVNRTALVGAVRVKFIRVWEKVVWICYVDSIGMCAVWGQSGLLMLQGFDLDLDRVVRSPLLVSMHEVIEDMGDDDQVGDISCSLRSCLLFGDVTGRVWSWANVNEEEALGRSVTGDNWNVPVEIPFAEVRPARARMVSSGEYHHKVLFNDGSLWAFGSNRCYGLESTVPSSSGSAVPLRIVDEGNPHVSYIPAISYQHSGVLTIDFQCFGRWPYDLESCSGKGTCKDENICSCDQDFGGNRCADAIFCFSLKPSDENVCGGHGSCTGQNTCVCADDWSGIECTIPVCQECVFGTCTRPNVCVCDDSNRYAGVACDIPVCFGVNGDDTANVCSGKGACRLPDDCSCDDGWKGQLCDVVDSSTGLRAEYAVLAVFSVIGLAAMIVLVVVVVILIVVCRRRKASLAVPRLSKVMDVPLLPDGNKPSEVFEDDVAGDVGLLDHGAQPIREREDDSFLDDIATQDDE